MSEYRPSKKPRARKRPKVKLGAAPGTIAVDPKGGRSEVYLTAFGPDGLEELALEDLGRLGEYKEKWPTIWVHVKGLGNEKVIRDLGKLFSLHDLSLEDVVSRNQRPKLEPYDNYLYIIAAAVARTGEGVEFEQVNLFAGADYVMTFQEGEADWREPVLKRLRTGRTRMARLGATYLSYALLDSIVDHYYPALEEHGERLDKLEEAVLANPTNDEIVRTHEIRNEIMNLRRALWPLQDVIGALAREEMPPVNEETRLYFRDLNDHIAHLLDAIESDREVARSLVELCMTGLSNRMNEVMKVLTIIATIFIPLSFIAGLYGMNFNPSASPFNMPELNWYLGYPFALLLMALMALSFIFFFKRRGWLGR